MPLLVAPRGWPGVGSEVMGHGTVSRGGSVPAFGKPGGTLLPQRDSRGRQRKQWPV